MPHNGPSFNQHTHDHIDYITWPGTWTVYGLAAQSLDPRFAQDNLWIVAIQTLGMLLGLPTVPTNTGLELCIANLRIVPSAHPHNIKCVRVSADQQWPIVKHLMFDEKLLFHKGGHVVMSKMPRRIQARERSPFCLAWSYSSDGCAPYVYYNTLSLIKVDAIFN